jgi:cytochrome c556
MKLAGKLMVLGLVLACGVAMAQEPSTPEVKARQEAMKLMGGAMKSLSEMANGKVAFDEAAATTAKETLVKEAAAIEELFKLQATDPVSEARPEVWSAWDDFVSKAGDLHKASEAIDTTSAETVGAGLGAVGGACKACHTAYRAS